MTIGKNPMFNVGAPLLTMLVLAGSSMYSIAGLGNELDKDANQSGKSWALQAPVNFRQKILSEKCRSGHSQERVGKRAQEEKK
jgi:hypothetical protein